jgi:uncharacterized phiE125 gp8 family phage protein
VRAGSSGHTYLITCKIVGNSGSQYELEAILPVLDIPSAGVSTGSGLVVPPTIEPITLAELKLHLRVDGTVEDSPLTELIQSAREYAEGFTKRKLITQIWDACLNYFPRTRFIELPFGNLQSVVWLKYKDCNGVETTLTENTDYIVEINGDQKGRIVLPYGKSWPSFTPYPSNPINIRFVCGWTTVALVPSKIKIAIKMLAGDYYNNREAYNNKQTYRNETVDALLYMEKLWEW